MRQRWATVPLGQVVTYRKEFIRIDDFQNYKRCRVQVRAKGIVLRDIVPGTAIKTKEQQVCKAGDLLVAEIDAKVGGFGIVPDYLEGAIVSSHYFLFQVCEDKLDRRFLEFFLRTRQFQEQVNAQGSTNYAAVRSNDVLSYKIPLPSLSEQVQIVAKTEKLTAKIREAQDLRERTLEVLPTLLDSTIDETFRNMQGADRRKLSSLTSKIGSGSTPKGGGAFYPSSGVPFIRSLNVRMREFQWDGIAFIDRATHEQMGNTKVKPNDVLLNITGASLGRVACVPSNLTEANVNQHVAIIRPIETLNPRYLMYWLSQPSIQNLIQERQKGATRQALTKAQIEAFDILVPSLDYQSRVVTYLDSFQSKVNAVKSIHATTSVELGGLFTSVLENAFATGT